MRCASSLTCMGGLVVGPSLSWCCLKCSCNCTRSLWGLLSSLYLATVSLSRSGMLWVVSRGVVLWEAGISSGSSYMTVWSSYLVVMLCFVVFPVILEQGFERQLSVVMEHLCVGLCICWEQGKGSHLPGKGCADHHERLFKCCYWILLVDGRWALDLFTIQFFWLFHCEISYYGTSVKVQYDGFGSVWRYLMCRLP